MAQLQEVARPSAASGAGPSAAPEASPAESQPQPATWAIKQWRKLAEPQRNKTHWDYLLEEMEWLSKDFKQEAAWKAALARKAVKAVSRWHAERAQLESKTHRSEEAQTRRQEAEESLSLLQAAMEDRGVANSPAHLAWLREKEKESVPFERLSARLAELRASTTARSSRSSSVSRGTDGRSSGTGA